MKDAAPDLVFEKLCRPFLDAGKACKTDKLEVRAALITERDGKKRLVYLNEGVFKSNNPGALIGGGNVSTTSIITMRTKARRCSG